LLLAACQLSGPRPIIKIGLSAPFIGFDESVGYSVIGAVRLAIRERNLAGGVAGYSVELVALDDGNEADVAAQRAREMIIDPLVMAVLGGFDGPAALSAATEYEQAGMPFVALTGADVLTERGFGAVFRLIGRDSEAGARGGRFATVSLGARRIAVVSEQVPYRDALTAAFVTAATAGGAAIVHRETIRRWQLDFADAIARIAASSPDLVFFAGRAAEAGELLKQMREAGVSVSFLGGPGTDDPRLTQIAGATARGAYYVSLALPLNQVSDAAARDRLAAASVRPAGPYTVLAYDGTQLLLDALGRAIKAKGKPSRAAVAEVLRSTVGWRGLSGAIAFDERGNREDAPLGVYVLDDGLHPGTHSR